MIPGEEQDEVPWTADAVLEYINSFESPVDAMQNIADTWNYRNEALDNAIANRDAAETEAERLRAALAEYSARAERTIAAQQEEIARLRQFKASVPWDDLYSIIYWSQRTSYDERIIEIAGNVEQWLDDNHPQEAQP